MRYINSQADQQQIEREEMFGDIVDNTDHVFAALNSEDIVMANMYVHPSQGYFNMKQQLHSINNFNPAVSECLSEKDDLDKLDYEIDYDIRSEFSNDEDREMMADFLHLRPVNGQELGGTYQPRRNITTCTNNSVYIGGDLFIRE